MTNRNEYANILMMTSVLRPLPTAKHHAWVCSAGSKGYCAVKEMLQNGIPGHTLLIESCDLRDVDASSEDGCLLTYCFPDKYTVRYRNHIPNTVKHLTVYGNVKTLGYTGLTTEAQEGFLMECTGLNTLDLSPLSQVTKLEKSFLKGCTGLTTINLSPLSQLREVQLAFLEGCTGLTSLELAPFSRGHS